MAIFQSNFTNKDKWWDRFNPQAVVGQTLFLMDQFHCFVDAAFFCLGAFVLFSQLK